MRVNPGDFVVLDYRNFDGSVVKGIYFVMFHEGLRIKGSNTFLAAKVSTKHSGFQVPVKSKIIKCLKHDSYINVSTLHRFKESEVKKIIGRGNDFIYNNVCGQLTSLVEAAKDQLQGCKGV